MNFELEVCAGSLSSAINARKGGAHRIELCDNLIEGGTTPSPGVIIQAVKLLNIPVFVLIRPRPGDFLYSDEEFEAMKEDIRFCKGNGAKGVVLGILKKDGTIDIDRCTILAELARPMQVTFHRAFDRAADPYRALEDIISLGIERIMTSGQAATAVEGSDLLSDLVKKAGNRIIIMPGSGITENNVAGLIKKTGAKEIHGSLRSKIKNGLHYQNEFVQLGDKELEEFVLYETDASRVQHCVDILKAF